MCDFSYHQEALRKARVIERKKAAQLAMASHSAGYGEDSMRAQCGTDARSRNRPKKCCEVHHDIKSLDPHPTLRETVVSAFNNRFRRQVPHCPHTDVIYPVIYPDHSNVDYTSDAHRNERRQNLAQDKYNLRRKVNGDFDLKVLAKHD